MEFICPVCGRFIEAREQQVFLGNRLRCSECWSALLIESTRPFRVWAEAKSHEAPMSVGSREVRRGGKNG